MRIQYSLIAVLSLSLLPFYTLPAQDLNGDSFPVRGFAIAAPQVQEVDRFIKFIGEELGPRDINVLILRVDYAYEFTSHPELREKNALSLSDIKKIVHVSQQHSIRLIPQINLLGHQSWAGSLGNLLKVYPEFDETPHVKIPEKYEWPNENGLYCKSYCPLHPDVHAVVFALVDEIMAAFEADAFHAGMDEVFYIGDKQCPRCGGLDKAELFAGEVTKIRNHLALKDQELWIWGDRLIDGKTTGIGFWEGSYNNTHRAIDLIPRDVVIADWHYERPEQTPVYFAMKGFKVATSTWNRPQVAQAQWADMLRFRQHSNELLKNRFLGVIQTVWSGPGSFMDGFYSDKLDSEGGKNTPWHSFKKIFEGEKP